MWGIRGPCGAALRRGRFIPTRVGNTYRPCAASHSLSVHPHACGEYPCCQVLSHPPSGSSPRVWGIRGHVSDRRGRPRFIPTRVGNTPTESTYRFDSSVHPHACGEYGRGTAHGMISIGSSPRVWGIRGPCRQKHGCCRFIPTRVGNTESRTGCDLAGHGSSPRVWGIQFAQQFADFLFRFIPTRVGNTATVSVLSG